MDIKFSCVCGQKVVVDSSATGQQFPCPSCGESLTVPSLEAPPPVPIGYALEAVTISKPNHVPQPAPTKPAKPQREVIPYVEYSISSLERLQGAGLVRKRVAESIAMTLPSCPWETVVNDYPQLLTNEGVRASVDREHYLRQRAHVSRLNLRPVVPKREGNEKPATDKQIAFLRSLGVDDERLLQSLGVRQASTVVDYVLDNKGKY